VETDLRNIDIRLSVELFGFSEEPLFSAPGRHGEILLPCHAR
jgi:hypothetical protein